MVSLMSRELFEIHFNEVNASQAYEAAELNQEEKELLYKKMVGEISDQDYNRAVMQVGNRIDVLNATS